MTITERKIGPQNSTDGSGKSSATPSAERRLRVLALALIAIVFGLLGLKEGGSVLFIDGTSRTQAGNYVPYVVWFNFLAGFAYIVAGVGLWLRRRWAVGLSIAIAVATLAASAALGLHIAVGGAFEPRTVVAMILRSVVWAVIAGLAWRFVHRATGTAHRLAASR